MNTLTTQLGWLFIALAAIFVVGIAPRFASRFYPSSPKPIVRFAAPLIFALLASAFFMGVGVQALLLIVLLGMTQIITAHWKRRKHS